MKRLIPALLALIFIFACSSIDDRRDSYLATAKQLEAAQKYAEAKIEARNALKLDPNAIDAHLIIGRIALSENDIRGAHAAFVKALELEPEHIDAMRGMASIMLKTGMPQKAKEYVNKIIELTPSSKDSQLLLAQVELQSENFSSAEEILLGLLSDDADNEEVLAKLSALYTMQKQPDKARRILLDALYRNPQSLQLLSLLLNNALMHNDLLNAELYIRRLLELNPENQALILRLSDVFFREKRDIEGFNLLESYLVMHPDAARVRIRLAEQYSNTKRFALAKELLSQAPEKTMEILFVRALITLQSGDEQDGIGQLKSIASTGNAHPIAIKAKLLLSDISLQKNDSNGALQELDSVLALSAGNIEAHTKRAQLLISQHRYDEAIADLRVVIRENPADYLSAISLANAQNAIGNSRVAEESLKDLIKKIPNNALGYLTLANLYVQLQRENEAIEILRFGRNLVGDDVADLYFAEAAILELRKDYNGAIDALTALSKKENFNITARIHISALYAKSGDYLKSISGYDLILKELPDYPAAIEGRLRVMIAANKIAEALDYAKKRFERRADPASAALLGEAALAAKDIPQAEQAFIKAMELAPQWNQPVLRLAQLYGSKEHIEDGISICQALIKKNPDALAPALLLALLQERNGNTDDAEKTYEQIVESHGQIPVVMNNWANLLSLNSPTPARLEKAEHLASVSAQTGAADAHSTLGWIYFQQGRHIAAESELRKALSTDPTNMETAYRLALTLIAVNKKLEAKILLSRMLDTGSDFSRGKEVQILHDSI